MADQVQEVERQKVVDILNPLEDGTLDDALKPLWKLVSNFPMYFVFNNILEVDW